MPRLILIIISRILSLTPVFLVTLIAKFLTWLGFDVLKVRRNIVLKNLRIALGQTHSEKEIFHIARQAYLNAAYTVFEFLRSRYRNPVEKIEIIGKEGLSTGLKNGHGAFIMALHLGNWEFMGSAINHMVGNTYTVVKRLGNKSVDDFVCEVREKIKFRVIHKGTKGVAFKKMLKALKEGDVIGFVVDQSRPSEPKLDLLGQPAKTNTSLARLWLRHKAPIFPAAMIRTSFENHKLYLLPELDLKYDPNLDDEDNILAMSQQFNDESGKLMVKHPELYFWFHNRWKE